MLNKKAIAALAAGATLVSGLAFATPSFAAEGPKQETCKVDEKALKAAQDAVAAAKEAKALADANVVVAENALKVEQGKYNAAKVLVEAYKAAYNAYKAAKDAEAGLTGSKLADAQAKTAHAADALKEAIQKANKNEKLAEANVAEGEQTDKTTAYETKLKDLEVKQATKDAVTNAKNAAEHAEYDLNFANYKLGKLQCKPSEQPGPQPGPQNPVTLPTVVADPTTKDEAINATRLAAMVLQNAENDLAKKNHDYNDVKAAYEKVIRELSVAKANLEKAQHDLDAFLASGVDDSAKETRLTDLRDRAQAHVTRLAAEFTALTLKYNDAKTASINAGAAFKAAKAQYKKIYNEAIALGVNPALLPVVATSDPLMPNFADPAGAKELYAEAVSGKFGDAVAAAAKKGQKEAKKGEAKKGAAAPAGAKLDTKAAAAASAAPLSKTGVTVMFTALAASMLAGIGAAVRKFRH